MLIEKLWWFKAADLLPPSRLTFASDEDHLTGIYIKIYKLFLCKFESIWNIHLTWYCTIPTTKTHKGRLVNKTCPDFF